MLKFLDTPFLYSQKLFLLKPKVDGREALRPEQFHAARQAKEGRSADEPARPDGALWDELPRAALLDGVLGGRRLDRVALTTDAGVGKTHNLHWLRHELNEPSRRRPAFLVPIAELGEPADLIERRLVPEVRTVPGNEGEDRERLKADLERLRQRGRLVLLLDGLDQAGAEGVRALARILEPGGVWARCRLVVAGRPFALERHWDTLFVGQPWQFVQIAEFDTTQQRRALGKIGSRDRYDFLPAESRGLLTIPRVLEYLRPLGEEQLRRLTTVADVYWEGACYMLNKAFRGRLDVLTQRRYLALLGALAFTMYAWPDERPGTNLPRPNLDRIAAPDMPDFLDAVRKRLRAVFPDLTEKEFLADVRKLSRLNTLLHHGWLDVRAVGGAGEDLLWRNASLQEFFAAFWATRWGTDTDARRVTGWVVDARTGDNEGFFWFWRYASEMPDAAILPNSTSPPASWLATMAPLYDGSGADQEERPIRSTEFIYRSWPRMERWSSKTFQTFCDEFVKIRDGKCGAKQEAVAKKLLAGFIPLVRSGKPDDTGSFLMGAPPDEDPGWGGQGEDNPQHRVTLSPFALHRFCVTNVEYELFDPRHLNSRWGQKDHPVVQKTGDAMADDLYPAINVSWYDAWCLTRWLGTVEHEGRLFRIALPTEAQWEYACRAGRTTPFTFHKGHDGMACTPDVCNFDGNYPFPAQAKKPIRSNAETYRQRTLPVESFLPNPWGFFQMHGNVWEWCEDWFAAQFYRTPEGLRPDPCNALAASARVLRGGSWRNFARGCRSAFRYRHEPDLRSLDFGFRLAAVPASLEHS